MGSLYPVLVKVIKLSRNGQTVYLLGTSSKRIVDLLPEEKAQLDIVLKALNEITHIKQRKIQFLHENPSFIGNLPCYLDYDGEGYSKFNCFLEYAKQIIGQLNNPEISLQGIEGRAIANKVACLLLHGGDFQQFDAFRDENKASEIIQNMNFKHLLDELDVQLQTLKEDIVNVPNEFEKELCSKQIEYCKNGVAYLKRQIRETRWPEEQSVVKFAKQSSDQEIESLIDTILLSTSRFLDSSIGHRILKSNTETDIVVVTGFSRMNGICQYMDTSKWSYDAECGNYSEPVNDLELNLVMRHLKFSEKLMIQLKDLNNYAHQFVVSACGSASSYLKSLGISSYLSK